MPPKSFKKYQKSVNKKPKWLEVSIENPDPGVVYNIYECLDQDCIKPHDIDKQRERFRRMIKVPWRKKKALEQCCAEHQALLKIKYKKCHCGTEFWGTRLKSSPTCKFCGINPEIDYYATPVRYYRRGEYFKAAAEDLGDPSRADCSFRRECLKVTFQKRTKAGIACKDCPYYSTPLDEDQ